MESLTASSNWPQMGFCSVMSEVGSWSPTTYSIQAVCLGKDLRIRGFDQCPLFYLWGVCV